MMGGVVLNSRRAAVRARIVGRLYASLARVLDQHAGMPAGFRVGHAELLDLMAHAGEPLEDRGVEAALHLEGGRALTPGAAEEPTRRVDRVRDADSVETAREDLGLELRLAVPAHGAVGHDPPVTEHREAGDQRMERLAPGLERIDRVRVERERR